MGPEETHFLIVVLQVPPLPSPSRSAHRSKTLCQPVPGGKTDPLGVDNMGRGKVQGQGEGEVLCLKIF